MGVHRFQSLSKPELIDAWRRRRSGANLDRRLLRLLDMQSPSTVVAILFLSLGISARELRTIFDDDASTSLIHFTPAVMHICAWAPT